MSRFTRKEIWRHNGFAGSARMTQAQMAAIQSSSTTTKRTKQLAVQIEALAVELAGSLKERAE